MKLHDSKLDNAGLRHVAGLKRLKSLNAERTAVTDAGLEQLAALQNLVEIAISGTKTTKEGVDKLQAAIPHCKVTWDGADPK